MKTKNLYLHLTSAIVLGVAIILSAGSIGGLAGTLINDLLNNSWVFTSERDEEDGTRTVTNAASMPTGAFIGTATAKTDEKGRWHGPYEAEVLMNDTNHVVTTVVLEVNMEHGKKHGVGIKTTTKLDPPSVKVDTVCYYMDKKMDCDSFMQTRTTDTSAYCILVNSYPFFMDHLWIINQDEDFIQKYLDTMEAIINSYDLDEHSFDDYYIDAQEELYNTVFDSLTQLNSDFTTLHLLDLMKDGRFRLAVFDRYLKNVNSTFQVISEYYPEYLLLLEAFEITKPDFEEYCHVFDSLLISYGPLNTEAFAFPDSLDDRIFRAYAEIDSIDQDSLTGIIIESRYLGNIFKNFEHFPRILGTLGDVNFAIALISYFEFYVEADIIRKCLKEAYYLKNGFIDYPTVTTSLKEQTSNIEARIQGYVVNDGGALITKRGIWWGQHHNPTMDDNQENAGSGTGAFSATLTGLTPGETYYARAFATNSAGTNVGNCVEFIAQQVTGTSDPIITDNNIILYPNPASTVINIQSANKVSNISILDINGRMVLSKLGEYKPSLNVSSLPDGVYVCSVKYKNGPPSQKKFLILH